MQFLPNYIRKVSAAVLLIPFLISCGSYNQKIQKYYAQLDAGRYHTAYSTLDNIKFLKRPRNQFLYNAEKGRIAHLMGKYDTSNIFLNRADEIAEDRFKSAGDITKGTLLNPMMQTYKGEPFERYMLHYYKALNYSALSKTDDAVVEARRITLTTNDQAEATKEKDNRYSRDAFALNLQGAIYESAGDINNAFIAYRNAAETYLSQHDHTWYGVPIPDQLEKDVIRTATLNGFTSEEQRFSKLFNNNSPIELRPDGGSLVLFIEHGRAPIKEEENLVFSLVKGAGGAFFFTDPTGAFNIPFDVSRYSNDANIGDLRTFRIALPKYMVVSQNYQRAQITVNEQPVSTELIQNINAVAIETMRERRLKDITNALTRLAVKKIAEAGARSAGTSIAKNNSKEKDKEKKDDKAEAVGDAVGLLFQAFSLLSEKADTRNWQSLPAYVTYVRIPLKKGNNRIIIATPGRKKETLAWDIQGNGGVTIRSVALQ